MAIAAGQARLVLEPIKEFPKGRLVDIALLVKGQVLLPHELFLGLFRQNFNKAEVELGIFADNLVQRREVGLARFFPHLLLALGVASRFAGGRTHEMLEQLLVVQIERFQRFREANASVII